MPALASSPRFPCALSNNPRHQVTQSASLAYARSLAEHPACVSSGMGVAVAHPRTKQGEAMHSTDIIAWHYDGSCYCSAECLPVPTDGPEIEGCGGPVFADGEAEEIGATCDTCHACYGPDGWSEPDCDPKQWRWSRCDGCGGQRPYARDDSDSRLGARRGALKCIWCGAEEHF